jgi:hypothetical protein
MDFLLEKDPRDRLQGADELHLPSATQHCQVAFIRIDQVDHHQAIYSIALVIEVTE